MIWDEESKSVPDPISSSCVQCTNYILLPSVGPFPGSLHQSTASNSARYTTRSHTKKFKKKNPPPQSCVHCELISCEAHYKPKRDFSLKSIKISCFGMEICSLHFWHFLMFKGTFKRCWKECWHGIGGCMVSTIQQSTSIMGINERLSMDIKIVIPARTLRFGGYVKARILFGYPCYYLGQHHSTT